MRNTTHYRPSNRISKKSAPHPNGFLALGEIGIIQDFTITKDRNIIISFGRLGIAWINIEDILLLSGIVYCRESILVETIETLKQTQLHGRGLKIVGGTDLVPPLPAHSEDSRSPDALNLVDGSAFTEYQNLAIAFAETLARFYSSKTEILSGSLKLEELHGIQEQLLQIQTRLEGQA